MSQLELCINSPLFLKKVKDVLVKDVLVMVLGMILVLVDLHDLSARRIASL